VQAAREAAAAGTGRQFLVTGPPRSGKSVALATLVATLRGAGWTAVYVPAPRHLLTGGAYAWNEREQGWDTPAPARALLASLLAAHADALAGVPLPSGVSAADAARAAVAEGPDAPLAGAVDAAVAILAALRTASPAPVLFAVDGYDALVGPSAFTERGRGKGVVRIGAGELRLVRALRALDAAAPPPPSSPSSAAVVVDVAALSGGARRVPAPRATAASVPRFDEGEWGALVAGWAAAAAARGRAPPLAPGGKEATAAFYLTGGAPGEVAGVRAAVL
jgi:hypothetical protein